MRLTSELVMKLTDKVSAPAAKLSAATKKAMDDLKKVDSYREQAKKLEEMVAAQEKARQKIKGMARDLLSVENPSKRMQRAYEAATAAADKLGNRIDWQKVRVRGAASELERMGVSVKKLTGGENQLKAAVDRATASMKRQEASAARWRGRREAFGTLAAGAGVSAGFYARNLAKKAASDIASFNIATLKQQEFVDISAKDQDELLIPQAKRIGQQTQFTNLDIVKAQTAAMQGLPSNITGRIRAEVGQGIIENVKNYALIMEADMETAAEAIRSYLQATGKDISTKEKALFEANKATNQLVRMAKLGGMSDEDVQQYVKFAASPGAAAGLTPESMMAMGALARRGGLRGDEAGTFIRATASKLVSPTKKGRAALAASGINFDDYRSATRVDVGALETQFRNDHGKGFSDKTRKAIARITQNQELMIDRGKFVEAVTEATAKEFARGKGRKVLRADRTKVAKSAGTSFDIGGGNVDVERLLDDAMSKNMTLAQLNAWLTDKHGGKGAITQRQWDEFKSAREAIRKSGEDPDYAKKKADHIMSGVGGAYEQAKGAVENFTLNVGKANEALIKFSLDSFSNVLDSFGKLSEESQRAATYLGLAGAAAGTLYGSSKLLGLLTGGGSAAALTASAGALDVSAAALTAAAVKLGGGDLPGIPGDVSKKANSNKVSKLMRFLGGALALTGVGYGAIKAFEYGEENNWGGSWSDGNPAAQSLREQERQRLAVRRQRDQELEGRYSNQRIQEAARKRGDEWLKTLNAPLPGLPTMTMPTLDTAGFDKAETRAKSAGDAIKDALDVTARPQIDTSEVDNLLAKVAQARRALQQLDGDLAAASRNAANKIQNRVDGNFSNGW